MSVLMEVSILVGEDRGWEFRRIGVGVAQERKQQEVGVVTWLEVGKIEGIMQQCFIFCNQRKGLEEEKYKECKVREASQAWTLTT